MRRKREIASCGTPPAVIATFCAWFCGGPKPKKLI
jgi:hypothetical protein